MHQLVHRTPTAACIHGLTRVVAHLSLPSLHYGPLSSATISFRLPSRPNLGQRGICHHHAGRQGDRTFGGQGSGGSDWRTFKHEDCRQQATLCYSQLRVHQRGRTHDIVQPCLTRLVSAGEVGGLDWMGGRVGCVRTWVC